MHHGMCATRVPWCMPGSLTSGFFWSRWRGKRSRHSRCMRNPQFSVSGKRPMDGTSNNTGWDLDLASFFSMSFIHGIPKWISWYWVIVEDIFLDDTDVMYHVSKILSISSYCCCFVVVDVVGLFRLQRLGSSSPIKPVVRNHFWQHT